MSAKPVSPRLGRGLAALLGDPAPVADVPAVSPTTGIASIAIEKLQPGPFQPRRTMEPQALSDLADSIRAQGVLQPLLARPAPDNTGQFEIIAGERRWRAAQLAALHEVPVLVRALTNEQAAAAALVENLQRQDLNPIEEAEGYQRLLEEFANTQEAIAAAVGKSRSHVANTLRLLNLPATVKEEVRKGALTAGHARTLVGKPDAEKLALAIISRGLNVRQAEALTSAKSPAPGEPKTTLRKDPETVALEKDLGERLGLKVDIAFDGKSGSVRIHYRSLDQLDGLIALLSRD
jgi:ParB family chromosome partitioning protein